MKSDNSLTPVLPDFHGFLIFGGSTSTPVHASSGADRSIDAIKRAAIREALSTDCDVLAQQALEAAVGNENDLLGRIDPVIFDTKCKDAGEADFSGYPDATAATEGRKMPDAAAPPELGQPSHLQTCLADADAPRWRCRRNRAFTDRQLRMVRHHVHAVARDEWATHWSLAVRRSLPQELPALF